MLFKRSAMKNRFILVFITLIMISLLSSCFQDAKTVYKIARNSSFPENLYGREKNIQGFTNDLFSTIAVKEHLQFELFNVPSDHLIDGLKLEQYDAIISTLTPNNESEETFAFSNPFYLLGPVLIVKEDSTMTSIQEMKGKVIGIKANSPIIFNLGSFPSILIRSYDNENIGLQDLTNNRIDGFLLDVIPALTYTKGFYAGQLKVISSPFTNLGMRIVTLYSADEQYLIEHFNLGLQEMVQDGSYDALLKKWDLFNTSYPEAKPSP